MSVQFTLFGEKFHISSERQSYNELYRRFGFLAESYTEQFSTFYSANYKNIEDVVNNSLNLGNTYIYKGIQEAIQTLIKFGIYEIDEEVFMEDYYMAQDYYSFQEHYESIKDKYMEIDLDEQRLDEYRKARRHGRGRIIGGGFGLSGAAKGIATAGALNMASGAMHGTFNLMGKMVSSISSGIAKSKIYDDPQTLNTLRKGLYYSIFNIHYSLIYILEKNKGFNFHYVTTTEEKKAKSIFNNLTKHDFGFEQKKQIILEMLNLDPYNSLYYEYIVDNFKGYSSEVEKISDYFGINIVEYKLKSIKETYKKLDFGSEAKAIESKEILRTKMINYEVDDIQLLNEIDIKLQTFKAKRTFEGILFNNEYECENAKDLHKKFIENKEIEYLNELELYELKKEFDDGIYENIPTKQTLRNIINEKLDFLDREKRTLFGIEYSTIDEVELAKKEFEEVKKIASNCNFSDEESLIKIKEELQREIKTGVDHQVIKRINKELDLIYKNRRTVCGIVFERDEDAKNAKEEYKILNEKFKNFNFNNAKDIKKAILFIEENHKTQIGNVFKNGLMSNLEKLVINTVLNLKIDEINKRFYNINDVNKKLAFSSFLEKNICLNKNEKAIFYYDDSGQRNGNEGFIISNTSVHYLSLGEKNTINLTDIKSINLKNDLLLINDNDIISIKNISKIHRQTFCNLLIALINMLKKE